MLSKLEGILSRYENLTELIADPKVLSNMDEWKNYAKERADMEETVEKYKEYKKIAEEKSDAEELLKTETDPEMKAMLEDEVYDCKRRMEETVEEAAEEAEEEAAEEEAKEEAEEEEAPLWAASGPSPFSSPLS